MRNPARQRVPGEPGGIEAGGGGAALEGADEAVVAEWFGLHPATFQHRAEQGAVADCRRGEPGLQRLDRAQVGAARDGDLLAFTRLVGLGAADHDAQPIRHLKQIGDREGQ